jgi:hypothetical protein
MSLLGQRRPARQPATRLEGNVKKMIAAVFAATFATVANAGGNATNTTAQSVMFNTSMNGSQFLLTDTQVFQFQRDVAAAHFTNSWDGVVPSGLVQGQAHGTTAPAAPSAPPPIDTKLNGPVNGNSCVFFNGGSLTLQGDTTYSQSVYQDVAYQDCKNTCTGGKNPTCTTTCTTKTDTYKYTYNYGIVVNEPDAVLPPLTAWTLVSNSPGAPVTATLGGTLAAETTVKKSKGSSDPWSFKTGFSLPNAVDPTTGQYVGVQNILATLTDGSGNVVEQRTLTNTVQHGVDFYYSQNAGYNGPYNQLVDGAAVSEIEKGLVFAIDGVTKDDFAGNNSSLGDLAVLDLVDFTIEQPGSYTVTVTGTLQGVQGVLPLSFSVAESIIYQAAGDACPAVVVPQQ